MVQQAAPKTHPAIPVLQKVLECEMAGIVRYLHYSFMIMGHNRIPIQKWFRDQANESVTHSIVIGEKIAEEEGDVALEELAREYVRTEQEHHDEVNKMLRSPK